jgi:SHS2 domain-containing protein
MNASKPGRHELRDHTADVILYVEAPTLEALFAEAARGLYASVGRLAVGAGREPVLIELFADRTEDLLRDWLAELLFRFDTSHVVVDDLRFDEFDSHHLLHESMAGRLDVAATVFDREVKAVTYHELAIERSSKGFCVSIILDI